MDKMLFENQIGDFQTLIDLINGRPCEITIKPLEGDKLRTAQQNKAIHKGCAQALKRCLDKGISKSDLYSKAARHEEFNVPCEEDIKNVLRVICGHLCGIPKTSKIAPNQVSDMWELASLAFSQRLGVDIGPFPSLEGIMNEQRSR